MRSIEPVIEPFVFKDGRRPFDVFLARAGFELEAALAFAKFGEAPTLSLLFDPAQ